MIDSLLRIMERIKQHRLVTVVVAIGTAASFIVGFRSDFETMCAWAHICDESPTMPSGLALLDLNQSRAFIEGTDVLGIPIRNIAESAADEGDAEYVLEADEREFGYQIDAVNSGHFPDADSYYNSKFVFATYRKNGLNIVVRYEKSSRESSAILIELISEDENCESRDMRLFRPLQSILDRQSPLCLGTANFNDFFPSLSLPEGDQDYKARCWGGASSGGSSGGSVEIFCRRTKNFRASPSLEYFVLIALDTSEDVDEALRSNGYSFYYFDLNELEDDGTSLDEVDPSDNGVNNGDLDGLLQIVGELPVQYVAVYIPGEHD